MRRQRLYVWIALCLLWLWVLPGATVQAAPGSATATSASSSKNAQKNPITRIEIIRKLWEASGKPIVQFDEYPFDDADLNPDSEDGQVAAWAYKNGIEKGVTKQGKTLFRPNETITRGKAVVYMYKASLKDNVMKKLGPVDMKSNKFSDADRKEVGYETAKAIAWAVQNGIVTASKDADGNVLFRPDDKCTKGEFDDMMKRYTQKKTDLQAT